MIRTVIPRTGFKPIEMIMGSGPLSKCFLERDNLFPLHHSVKNNAEAVRAISQEISEKSEQAKANLTELRQSSHKSVNKKRIIKEFSVNDIVFTIDRQVVPRNTRPLKTKFHPSPYVVLKPIYNLSNTAVV